MIFVDDRIGSADMAAPLRDLGCPVTVVRQDYGDVVFAGNGPNGTTVQVALEIKRIPDLLNSFVTGRLANHQLPGLTANFDSVVLIVEGRYRASSRGGLEWATERDWREGATICNWSDAGYGLRTWMYSELEGRLNTLQLKAGVRVARTASPDETARYIAALYVWWTASEYADHRSHEATFHKAQMPMLRPPTLRERIASQLPGIGDKKATAVAATFDSVRSMINADRDQWCGIDRIGPKMADTIIAAVSSK